MEVAASELSESSFNGSLGTRIYHRAIAREYHRGPPVALQIAHLEDPNGYRIDYTEIRRGFESAVTC